MFHSSPTNWAELVISNSSPRFVTMKVHLHKISRSRCLKASWQDFFFSSSTSWMHYRSEGICEARISRRSVSVEIPRCFKVKFYITKGSLFALTSTTRQGGGGFVGLVASVVWQVCRRANVEFILEFESWIQFKRSECLPLFPPLVRFPLQKTNLTSLKEALDDTSKHWNELFIIFTLKCVFLYSSLPLHSVLTRNDFPLFFYNFVLLLMQFVLRFSNVSHKAFTFFSFFWFFIQQIIQQHPTLITRKSLLSALIHQSSLRDCFRWII